MQLDPESVIDRATHYRILTELVPGTRQIDTGTNPSPW